MNLQPLSGPGGRSTSQVAAASSPWVPTAHG